MQCLCNFFFQFCHIEKILIIVFLCLLLISKHLVICLFSCLTLKFSEKWKVKLLTLAKKKKIVENVDKGMLFYEYYVWLIFVTFDRFVCFCLFVVLCPTGEYFTYMETSPLLAKSCKCWPILGSHGHWAMRIRYRSNPHALAFWTPAAVHPTDKYFSILYSITGILIKIVLFRCLCKPVSYW